MIAYRHRTAGAAMALIGAMALASCSGSERSAEYFASHEAEAKEVVANCSAGVSRGAECDNAARGLQQANGARAYKKSDYPTSGGKSF
ncbi:hypothetical protein CA235_17125 [Sphingomonas sp. ABOLF]|uniref:EexN family lipoprotein n=1 Tax=Sphingomonas sp. ABOLF TaxID=1985879 RepID=UPI000F7E1BB6|nr:EexN family lipoprotein [Sphingomonas sp. ABOLF]RSV12389.1 hypothetical protein CA235_17125 [Sphingomonas sp. ABOLF]